MSSLIHAFRNWILNKKDQAADAITDPEVDAKIAIEDSERLVNDFESKIADLMAHNKRVAMDVNAAKQDVDKWSNIATKAAAAGNRDDCTVAIKNKAEAAQKQERLQHEVEIADKTIAGLRVQLDATKEKIAHAKDNKEVLSARLKSAEIRKQLTKASTAMDSGGPLAALDTLERKTVECETGADAIEELHGNKEEELANKYSAVNAGVDDEVSKMMAAAGKK